MPEMSSADLDCVLVRSRGGRLVTEKEKKESRTKDEVGPAAGTGGEQV